MLNELAIRESTYGKVIIVLQFFIPVVPCSVVSIFEDEEVEEVLGEGPAAEPEDGPACGPLAFPLEVGVLVVLGIVREGGGEDRSKCGKSDVTENLEEFSQKEMLSMMTS